MTISSFFYDLFGRVYMGGVLASNNGSLLDDEVGFQGDIDEDRALRHHTAFPALSQDSYTPEELRQKMIELGVKSKRVTRAEKREIKTIMKMPDFITEAERILAEAILCECESEAIHVYKSVADGTYLMDSVPGSPCVESTSPTCMIPEPPSAPAGYTLVTTWHPHPKGGTIVSPSDYNFSKTHGVPGVFWAKRGSNGKHSERIFKGQPR